MGCTATCRGNERERRKRSAEREREGDVSPPLLPRKAGAKVLAMVQSSRVRVPPVAWISADFGGGGGGEEAPGRPQGQQVPTHARLASLPAERRCGDARPRARAKYNVHCLPPPPPQYSSPRWNPLFSALSLN